MGLLDLLLNRSQGQKPEFNKNALRAAGIKAASVAPLPAAVAYGASRAFNRENTSRSNEPRRDNKPKPRPGRNAQDILKGVNMPTRSGTYGNGLGVLKNQNANVRDPMMDLLASLGQQGPSIDISGMLRQQYQPQFDAIKALEDAARAENERARGVLSSAFASGVSDIRAQAPVLQGFHDTAKSSINQSADAAVGGINSAFDESAAKQAALRERLGLSVEGAVSEAAIEAERNKDFLAGLVEASRAGNVGLVDNNAASANTFNTQQANITQQEGLNAQAGLNAMLGQQLGEYGMKRADLLSQQAGQQADFTMRQADQDWQQQRWFAEQMLANQRAQMDAAAAQEQPMSPWDNVLQHAIGVTGDPNMANRALDLIRSASMEREGDMGNTLGDFLRFVAERNGADGRPGRGYLPSNMLSNIASMYWQQMDPRAPMDYSRIYPDR